MTDPLIMKLVTLGINTFIVINDHVSSRYLTDENDGKTRGVDESHNERPGDG
jgi:hypothetical protein